MKLGPLHVIQDGTWVRLEERANTLERMLADERAARERDHGHLRKAHADLEAERDARRADHEAFRKSADELNGRIARLEAALHAEQIALKEAERRLAEAEAARAALPSDHKGPHGISAFAEHSFMHVPINVRTAPQVILDGDDPDSPRAREAAGRVIEAFHRATGDGVVRSGAAEVGLSGAETLGLWDGIAASPGKREFFGAVHQRDAATAARCLSRFLQNDLVWGLGKVHESMPANMREHPADSYIQLRAADALLSLAQSAAARPIVSIQHQGFAASLRELDADPEALLADAERATGLDVSMPEVAGAYGVRVGGKLLTVDSLIHSHTAYRLRQLGAGPRSRIVEIGGGYGCLAAVLARNGFAGVEVYDLPWVNMLQGYFLIMSLPPGAVRLHGEPETDATAVRLSPHTALRERADGSADFVVNTDSLPEMPVVVRRGYAAEIRRLLARPSGPPGVFLSVNQESGVRIGDLDPQGPVAPLLAEVGGWRTLSRHRGWMCQGYVEEVFAPAG
jgi:hypothetical protein